MADWQLRSECCSLETKANGRAWTRADALLEANRPELTVEAIVLQPKFQGLFTATELAAAKDRLGEYGKAIAVLAAERQRLYPDELEPGQKYAEGAKKQIRVNA